MTDALLLEYAVFLHCKFLLGSFASIEDILLKQDYQHKQSNLMGTQKCAPHHFQA